MIAGAKELVIERNACGKRRTGSLRGKAAVRQRIMPVKSAHYKSVGRELDGSNMLNQSTEAGNRYLLRHRCDAVACCGQKCGNGEIIRRRCSHAKPLCQQNDCLTSIRRDRRPTDKLPPPGGDTEEIAVLQGGTVFFVPFYLLGNLFLLLWGELSQIQLVPQCTEGGDIEAGGKRRLPQRLLMGRL